MSLPARLRSLLFAPASRPDVCAKLPRSGPDGVVLDLEDAVAVAAKPQARGHALDVAAGLRAAHPDLAVFVRVNAVESPWFADDVAAALHERLTGVVVPKLETAEQAQRARAALVAADRHRLALIAGIETAAGVAGAAEVLGSPGVDAAYFGAEDFITDMGGVRTEPGTEVLYARSQVALVARLCSVPVLDQVVTTFGDDDRFRADAAQGRAIGYTGKLCIHPSQVPLANECFTASATELQRARALLAAWRQAQAEGEAVVVFDGQMVDEPLARRAEAMLFGHGPGPAEGGDTGGG